MLIDNSNEAVSQRLRLAMIAIGLLLLASKESYTLASEPIVQQTQVESEFTSIEAARAAEKKLLALSDSVTPAVVKLSGTGGEERLHSRKRGRYSSFGLDLDAWSPRPAQRDKSKSDVS